MMHNHDHTLVYTHHSTRSPNLHPPTGLERILLRNPSYDARGMLEGMDAVLDSLVNSMQVCS